MSSPSQLRSLLIALGRENQPVRLLCGPPGEPAYAPLISWAHVDEAVDAHASDGENVWFEVQPSSWLRDLGRSNAVDVTAISAIYADIDYKAVAADRPGMGSELGAQDLIDDLTAALGLEPTAVVKSGHGMQPYWRIDDAAVGGDITVDDLAGILRRWGLFVQHFATARLGNVDNVFDLPRVLRAPGPDNLKDPERPEPTSITFSSHGAGFSLTELSDILDEHGIERPTDVPLNAPVLSPRSDWTWADHDCTLVPTILREIQTSEPQARHQWALKIAAIIYGMLRNGCVTEDGFTALRDALIARMRWLVVNQLPKRTLTDRELRDVLQFGLGIAQKWDDHKLASELRGHSHDDLGAQLWAEAQRQPDAVPVSRLASVTSITGQPMTQGGGAMLTTQGAVALSPHQQQALITSRFTDTGNAEILASWFSGRFIFVPGMGWQRWDGSRYQPDQHGGVVELAKQCFQNAVQQAATDESYKWARKSLSKGSLTAALSLTETIPSVSVAPMQLDEDGTALATPGGIVDLATGTMRPANPLADFVTRSTRFAPDPEMPTPRFDAFMRWAFSGDEAMIAYLQRLFGLALIGELRFHVFPIFLGVGANGKTTLLDIMAGILGDYAAYMPQKFLVAKKGENHPTDIARLRGIRMGIASEVPPNAQFEEDLVKQIAGESSLTGRFMGQDFITFPNQVTMFLAANHLPSVRVGGTGFWRRVRKVDFENHVAVRDQDERLVAKILGNEGPGILAWAIAGAVQISTTHALEDPERVMDATRVYEHEEDEMLRFLLDAVVVEPTSTTFVGREQLYGLYRNWCFSNGLAPLTNIKFNREVTTRYPTAGRGGSQVFSGMSLKTAEFHYLEE